MFFSATSILALVGLLATPVISAPIHVYGGSNSITSHPVNAGLEKRSPMFWGQGHHHYDPAPTTIVERDVLEYSDMVARDDSSILEARSTDRPTRSSLAKSAEGGTMRLVRRKSIFTKIKEGFQKAGKAIKSGFQKAGAAIKTGFQKVGAGIKKVAQKVGNGIKTAAKKVGNFVKTTGAKIAKFGLKVYATATKIAGHVASFIPGIGKPISKALSGVSKVANFVSDKIHANLGKKLEKGISVMNKIQNPVGGVAGKVLDAVLKRDVDEEHLFERDLSELETRSFEDGEGLEARSFEGEEIEARSFDDAYELEVRSFDDPQEFESQSWDFGEDYGAGIAGDGGPN